MSPLFLDLECGGIITTPPTEGAPDTHSTDDDDDVELLLIHKCCASAAQDTTDDGDKKHDLNKSSRPPRPPKGPLLTESDLNLVKHLSQLAARKRARIERIKALRKMKDMNSSTSTANLTAMLFTALFFIVIIFQGIQAAFSGDNARVQVQLIGSPAPATTNEAFISNQLFYNAPTNHINHSSSFPPHT